MQSSPPLPTEAELSTATPTELLLLASRLGRTDLAVSALRSGASANPSGTTPLHIALSNGHVDVARALLAAGGLLSSKDNDGQTPIDLMLEKNTVKSVLASHVCQRAAAGDLAAVKDAADAGLDLCAPDLPEAGNTPLHWAASFGQVKMVKVLLDAGVPPDLVNGKGETGLMDGSRGGFVSVVRVLMGRGANVELRNKDGKTAVDVAGGDEVVGVLMRREDREEPDGGRAEEPTTPFFVPGERLGMKGENPGWGGLLWPKPKRFVEVGGGFTLPPVVTVSVEGRCIQVGRMFVQWLGGLLGDAEYNVRLVGGGQGGLAEAIGFKAAVFLRVDEYAVEGGEEGYRLTVRDFGVDIVGGGMAGLFYGCATLENVFRMRMEQAEDASAPLVLPTFSIADWPSVRRRGLYLDVGGRAVPSSETLKRVVKFMAKEMKMNQLQLNVGRNFARLEDLKKSASLRHEDFLQLGDICQQNFVELIPVVGSKPLAETTLDNLHIVSNGDDFVGDSRKKAMLERELLYDEFLPLFNSEQVNLGDLSNKPKCDFSDYEKLRSAFKSLRSRGKRTVLVFGNKITDALLDPASASGILAELPTRCIMILEAQEGKTDKLRQSCQVLRQHGLAFYTCSSSYLESSIAGRTSVSLELSRINVDLALEYGATGVLMKDTSTISDGAPLVFLFQSLVAFAGAAWNAKEVIRNDSPGPDGVLSHLYDMYIYKDPIAKGMLGNISISLGDLHQIAGDRSGVALYNLLAQPHGEVETPMETMTYLGLRRALKRAERIENALSSYTGNASKVDVQELRFAAILLGVAARMGASLFSASSAVSMDPNKSTSKLGIEIESLPDGRRSDLCNALLQGIELMRAAWITRYHEDGFADTVQHVTGETLSKLSSGMPYQQYLEERKAEGWVLNDNN